MSGNDAEELQPIPDSIKYGAIGGGVLFVLIIAWLILSSSNDEEDTSKLHALTDIENITIESGSDLKIPIDSFVPVNGAKSAPENDVFDETNLPIVQPESERQLIKIEEQFNQFILDNNIRQQSQDQLINDLQSQLTAQRLQIEQLQNNKKARQLIVKSKKKKVRRYKKLALPFTLVSVDQWGNDAYAVIRMYGQLHELTAGQAVDNNWHIQSIDRSKRVAVFKHKKGKYRELAVER